MTGSDIAGLSLAAWLFGLQSLISFSICFKSRRACLSGDWSVLVVYMASGLMAAAAMISILVIIIWQMIARWVGFTFEGSTEFAGYAMAATSFFALAHLRRGAVSGYRLLDIAFTVSGLNYCPVCGRVNATCAALCCKDKFSLNY